MTDQQPAIARRNPAEPVLIVVPSLVSGAGVVLVLVGLLINQQVVRDILLSTGIVLLWLDFFITMAIFRYTLRNVDRRLRAIEERLSGR